MTALHGPRLLALVGLLVAGLLLAGAGAGAGAGAVTSEPPATDPQAGPGAVLTLADTPNQAALSGVTRRTYAQADLDVASAVSVGATRVGGRHAELTLEERLERAGSPSARLGVVTDALAGIEQRFDRLGDRQRQLLTAYSEDEIETPAFLRRVGAVRVAAAQERALLDRLGERAGGSPRLSLPVETQTQVARLRGSLVALPNPVLDRVIAGTTGARGSRTVYLEAASDGLVAATVDDGTYLRQATLRADRSPGEPNRFESITAAYERAGELYPWVFENAIGSPSLSGFGDASVYLIEASHSQGDLQAYLDGATRNVFHETQTNAPEAVPVALTRAASTDSLRVQVNATHPTGPMAVAVTRPENPNTTAVDATVRINGQRVGTTGDDGRLLTVQPAGSFRVNATAGAANVTLSGP
jgi:hypothetical protein